ncbi:aromatic-ring-hydroxylating dioxygenase beta subunit [Pseudonocardia dioxanivorans CB1190]|uniref:Aromatic-ring-hydroxylating dioxygenase beta subunit n=1 Tax=Pseudonocardia dioxanivorans (strain ATCC 55486 / DSM 44775 / JCM 13855 / CB1190) TaxID=675635 RepID=F4CNP0_PSEUX|nr:aromatic-ring-hydroxylating dioxygenase subunit beta [Pseudonocardia dioxanivorans]AEA22353.1 aromatic-ring-hydroxylating dioxygenase beta subunit [Pseudonocardia dioxanivorans CB1190]
MDNQTAIARAQAHYARCIDDGPLDDWPLFFTEDCHYRITTADNYSRGLPAGVIWADTRGMLRDRVSALQEANIYEPHVYRHMLGLPAVLSESGGDVRSETPFVVMRVTGGGPTDVFATGRYVDRYHLADGRALLRERVVVCDSKEIDTLLALPL